MNIFLGGGCAFTSGIFFGLAIAWSRKEVTPVATLLDSRTTTERVHALADEIGKQRASLVEIKENMRAEKVQAESIARNYQGGSLYISEEQWLDDDDYDKIELVLLRDDDDYVVTLDGEELPDGHEVITPEVMEDLKGVLCVWLRNEKKKVDYEVIWGQP